MQEGVMISEVAIICSYPELKSYRTNDNVVAWAFCTSWIPWSPWKLRGSGRRTGSLGIQLCSKDLWLRLWSVIESTNFVTFQTTIRAHLEVKFVYHFESMYFLSMTLNYYWGKRQLNESHEDHTERNETSTRLDLVARRWWFEREEGCYLKWSENVRI